MTTSPSRSHAVASSEELVDGLVQLSFLIQDLLGRAGADAGLTTVQIRLLGILRDREPSMGEIARHLDLDKSSVTGLVDRAERRGLVRRISSTDDGRSTRVALTPAGKRLAAAGTRDIGNRMAELVEGLNPSEARQLAALAHRLLGATGEDR